MPFPEPLNWSWSTSLMKIDLHYFASMIKPWIPHTLCNANSLLCLNVSWWFKLVFIVTIYIKGRLKSIARSTSVRCMELQKKKKNLLLPSLIPLFTQGGRGTLSMTFVTTPQGARPPCLSSQTHLLHEGSVTWKIMTSSPFLSVFG